MSVRMRHTRAQTANRRSHHALVGGRFSACAKCSSMHLRHAMCPNCGTYRGRQVVDVAAGIVKKEEKRKARLAAEQPGGAKQLKSSKKEDKKKKEE